MTQVSFRCVVACGLAGLAACADAPGERLGAEDVSAPEMIAGEVRGMTAEERTFLPEAYKQVMLDDIRASEWAAQDAENEPHCRSMLETVLDDERTEMLEPVAVAARYGDEALKELRGACRALPNRFFWGGSRQDRSYGEHGYRLYQLSDEVSLISLENVRQDIDITWLGEKRADRPCKTCEPGAYYSDDVYYQGRGTYFRVMNMKMTCRVRQVQQQGSMSSIYNSYKQANYLSGELPYQDFVVLKDPSDKSVYLTILSGITEESWVAEEYRGAEVLNIISLPTEDFGSVSPSAASRLWPYDDVTGHCEFKRDVGEG